MTPASQAIIVPQGHPRLEHKERVGRERSPGALFLWTIGVTPLRVFQRGHAPTTVDPLPSCCKQGSPEGMLEQESAVQVEGGKGRVHCIVVGSRPYKEPGVLSLDLICHFSSISVSSIWDCAQPRSAGTCEKPQFFCTLSPAQPALCGTDQETVWFWPQNCLILLYIAEVSSSFELFEE